MSDKDVASWLAGMEEEDEGETTAFHTGMIHLYRGEMNRMTVWRERLDITSNWAILLTVALATFTLGSLDVPHYTLLLGLAIIGISILIEARRYRHLNHSKWRLHLLEVGYFGELLKPSTDSNRLMWQNALAEDLRHPNLLISWFFATKVRLRRNYLLLLYFVFGVWITKLFIHPESPGSPAEFFSRFAVGDFIPDWLVVLTATFFIGTATVMAMSCPSQEELENWGSPAFAKNQGSRQDARQPAERAPQDNG